MTMSMAPDITAWAAKWTACWAEPHWRSTVVPGTVSGKPAASAALRPMFMACSPTVMVQPMTTSSTRAGSRSLRSTSALSGAAARSTGCQPESLPLRRPTGVRSASTITAVGMTDLLGRAGRVAPATDGAPAPSIVAQYLAVCQIPVPWTSASPPSRSGSAPRPGRGSRPTPRRRVGARARCRRSTPPRGSRPTGSGRGRCTTPGGRSCRGPRSTGGAGWVCSSGSSSRRSTTGPGRRRGSGRTASSSWRPRCSSSGRRSRRRGTCRPWPRGRRSGARDGPSPTPAATSPPSAVGPRCGPPDGDAGCSTARRRGARAGAFADWIFGLFRSDPEAERHRGLTYFLVPMDSPGVTVRPIAQLDGETGFAEVFFEDVEVPDDAGARRRGRGVGGGHGDGRVRARAVVAQPGSRTPRRRAAGRAVPQQRDGDPARAGAARRRRGPGRDRRRGVPAADVLDRHPGARRRAVSVPRPR